MTKQIATQEDLDNNADLVTEGVKVDDEIIIPNIRAEATALEDEDISETDGGIQPYLDAYPNNDKFYRTTDGQVFLSNNLADLHQRTLTGDNKFQIFKR